MTNEVLLAIPLFIFMGVMLERSRIAEELLETMGRLFGTLRGGLGISVVIVGMLLAAAKGVVGATTVTMGLIVLPTMLRHGYDKRLAAGTVAATATLAQIFPPATVLVLLGDQLTNAYQAAQLAAGQFRAVVGDGQRPVRRRASCRRFALVALYILYLIFMAVFFPKTSPAIPPEPGAPKGLALARPPDRGAGRAASPDPRRARLDPRRHRDADGSRLGRRGRRDPARGASKARSARRSRPVVQRTTQITCMIFVILIGATLFSLVFRGLGGDDMVHRALANLPGGAAGAILVVMLAMFLLGFVMDAFEIIFVVVPIVAPPLLTMHRRRSGLARHHDGDEPADLLHAPAARADLVLPARRRAAGDHHPAHLCRHHPVRADPALRAGGAVVRAGACDRAAACALWGVRAA